MTDDLTAQRRRTQAEMTVTLGVAFLVSCFAAYVLLRLSAVAGFVLGGVALALAVFGVARVHRYPTAEHRARFAPGQLGSFRALTWSLALMTQLPAFIAATVWWDR
ncbi:hypothetical protein [Asanoa siamensis]|nr:hypothetical protein [Asanoa siamensis]